MAKKKVVVRAKVTDRTHLDHKLAELCAELEQFTLETRIAAWAVLHGYSPTRLKKFFNEWLLRADTELKITNRVRDMVSLNLELNPDLIKLARSL